MAKAILEFDLPRDQKRFEGAVFGQDSIAANFAFEQWLIEQIADAHGRKAAARGVLTECLEKLREFMKNAESEGT